MDTAAPNVPFSEQIAKASVLIEAMPYLQRFRGQTFLIKFGGSAMDDPALVEMLLRDVVFLELAGINPVVVHGGGKAISAAMQLAGLKARFVGGLRVTDEQTIAIVEHTLHNEINRDLVAAINRFGGRAIGLPGKSVFLGHKNAPVKGEDGEPVDLGFPAFQVRADLLADKSTGQPFELDRGFVICAALGSAFCFTDRAQALEHPQSLAGRAFADVEALHEIVQRECGL